jgi:hypothetical protein
MIIKLRSQQGQSLFEFALVLPLLLVLIFGLIEFSLILFDKGMITRISREAARAGVVFQTDSGFNYSPKTDPDIRADITNYVNSHVKLVTFGAAFDPQDSNDVIIKWSSNNSDPSSYTLSSPSTLRDGKQGLKIVVQFEYHFLVLQILPGLPDPITLTSTSIMKME